MNWLRISVEFDLILLNISLRILWSDSSSNPPLLTSSLWSHDSSLQWWIRARIAETMVRWWWFLGESLRTSSNSLNLLNLVAIDCGFLILRLGFNEGDEVSSLFLWKQFLILLEEREPVKWRLWWCVNNSVDLLNVSSLTLWLDFIGDVDDCWTIHNLPCGVTNSWTNEDLTRVLDNDLDNNGLKCNF
jgi:hypothetical protein